MANLILNRCTEGKGYDTKPYPGKIYIPQMFKSESGVQTPGGPPERSTVETVSLCYCSHKKIKTLYLPSDFQLHEKIARNLTTPARKKGTPAKSGATPSTKKRKRKETTPRKTKTPKSKSDDTSLSPRTTLSRSAKKQVAYEDAGSDEEVDRKIDFEEDSDEEEEENQEEEEDDDEPARSIPQTRKRRKL